MGMRERLAPSTIDERIRELSGWQLCGDGQAIERHFKFGSFASAFAFMTQVALLAEKQDHHPDWSNSYRQVQIRFTSHDVGGLSERDFVMARLINKISTAE